MVIIIAGASHSGKTCLAQKLLEKYHYPYLSIDHLKMGLIRSGQTELTPCDDAELTGYLWPIVREMIKTAIENGQNLIVEGCYIPYNWRSDFEETYLCHIKYLCLILSERYIRTHFDEIRKYTDVIEQRLDDSDLTPESLLRENKENLSNCKKMNLPYLFIESDYVSDLAALNMETLK